LQFPPIILTIPGKFRKTSHFLQPAFGTVFILSSNRLIGPFHSQKTNLSFTILATNLTNLISFLIPVTFQRLCEIPATSLWFLYIRQWTTDFTIP
jgi:hypothetical protein